MHRKEAPVSLELGSCWASAGDSLLDETVFRSPKIIRLSLGSVKQQEIKAAANALDLVADRIFGCQCLDALEQWLI